MRRGFGDFVVFFLGVIVFLTLFAVAAVTFSQNYRTDPFATWCRDRDGFILAVGDTERSCVLATRRVVTESEWSWYR